MIKQTIKFIIFILFFGFFMIVLNRSITIHFENQSKMLCKSAKISGNTDYSRICECYYRTGKINCINNE